MEVAPMNATDLDISADEGEPDRRLILAVRTVLVLHREANLYVGTGGAQQADPR